MSNKGVTYIKINRIDAEGNDNTLSLQALTNIRIKYSDIGVIDYPIYTIAEYPDYYLYQLYQTDITSSTDNNILDYKFIGQTSSFNGIFDGRVNFTPISDPLNYYVSINDQYILQSTPSNALTCSFTGSINTTGPGNTNINIESDFNGILSQTILAGGASYPNIYIAYSGSFLTNDRIYISYRSNDGFTINNGSFLITQSIVPTSSLNLVILEPYLTENFEFSDCNVLYGNVDSYPFNPLYMDVDYTTNGMIAINTNQIIAGSATRSTVKPYYYSLRRHIRPRYNGSKNIDKGVFEFDNVLNFLGAAQILTGSFDFSNFIPGSNINIYQNNNFKGIATILTTTPSSLIIGTSSAGFYNVNFPVKIVDLELGKPGIAYLTPNTYENSNIFPLDEYKAQIFEFKQGVTSFPEIPNSGMLVMGDILEVADKDNVNILTQGSPYFEAYNKIIGDNFVQGTDISDIRQYGDGKQILTKNIKVITSDFGTPFSPDNSGDPVEYWIPTNGGNNTMITITGSLVKLNTGEGAYEIELNELDQYSLDSTSLIPSHSVVNTIINGLNNGDRWFITIYNKLPNPLTPRTLIPYLGYDTINMSSSNTAYPLLSRGVYEIISGSSVTNPPVLNLNYNVTQAPNSINLGSNTGEYGAIIWKALIPSPKGGKYVITDKSDIDDLGQGAIILSNSSPTINENFNEITINRGANPKPTSSPRNNSGRSVL